MPLLGMTDAFRTKSKHQPVSLLYAYLKRCGTASRNVDLISKQISYVLRKPRKNASINSMFHMLCTFLWDVYEPLTTAMDLYANENVVDYNSLIHTYRYSRSLLPGNST